jgi:predicted nucleic acid-binding protein
VKAYVDTSVLLRVVLGEPRPLTEWRSIDLALTSELTRIEALRTIDRARIELRLSDTEVAERRALILGALDGFHLARLDGVVLDRAAEPFPTLVRTLDAIHLATALLSRAEHQGLVFATHDHAQAMGARSVGFRVIGAPSRLARAKLEHPS